MFEIERVHCGYFIYTGDVSKKIWLNFPVDWMIVDMDYCFDIYKLETGFSLFLNYANYAINLHYFYHHVAKYSKADYQSVRLGTRFLSGCETWNKACL